MASPSESAQVSGEVVLSVVHVMGAFRSLSMTILAENGIEDPKPDAWYPLGAFLAAFDTMMERMGPNTLAAIGRQIVSQAVYPPEVTTVEHALHGLDPAYQQQHRGGEVGHYSFIPSGERSGTMVSTTPYPADFDRGLIHALVERFEPDGLIDVRRDAQAESRNAGGTSCTFLVSW